MWLGGSSRVAVGVGLYRERARQGGASREVTLPSQTTFLKINTKIQRYKEKRGHRFHAHGH